MAERHIAAYFYPHDTEDPNRMIRAQKHGFFPIPNETRGSNRVLDPLGKIRSWTDRDPETVGLQMKDAKAHGIDTFLVCTYPGCQDGSVATEYEQVADVISQQAEENDMNYAFMMSIKRPPNRIPYPVDGSPEPNRYFDFTKETLHTMVDFASRYWHKEKYLKIYNNRPFMLIYGLTPSILREFENRHIDVGYTLSSYAEQRYGESPYLVAVVDSPDMASTFRNIRELDNPRGFAASTTYAGLGTFYERALNGMFGGVINRTDLPLFQSYTEQLLHQISILEKDVIPYADFYYPSAVAGWDPILRCDPQVQSDNIPATYPYRPRIIDSTPAKFLNMMVWVWLYHQAFYWNLDDQDEFPYTICSWNDIGDGTDILRKIDDTGKVDDGYLEAVKTFASLIHSPIPLIIIKQLAQDGKIQKELIQTTEKILERKKFMSTNPGVSVLHGLGTI